MTAPETLVSFEQKVGTPAPGRALIEVAGCGVCHTDLGYLYGGVPTKKGLPIVLGHEVAGVVIDAGPGAEKWVGKRVIAPAVAPCGECRWCKAGRPTSCKKSKMPGNDEDGGFATHVDVPAHSLCEIDAKAKDAPIGAAGLALWEVSVVADAVSTPMQAIRRAGLAKNDVAIVVGAGGVGGYAVQLAKMVGAHVVAIDIDEKKLARAKELGAALTLDSKLGAKAVKAELKPFIKSVGAESDGWRVFETSGHPAGQELAWGLLTTGGAISVVGYTPEPTKLRLSNLMAFDATAYGNWGADPALYPDCLEAVASGAVKIRGQVRKESLADAPKILERVHHGEFAERVVLVP